MQNAQDLVNNAKSLIELCEILRELSEKCREAAMNEPFTHTLEDYVDLCSLPTFGGGGAE